MTTVIFMLVELGCISTNIEFMRGPEIFFKGGPFFLVNEWIQLPFKMGHHWPASETPFKWRFAGGPLMAPTLNAGLVALWFFRGSGQVLLRNPIFCDLSWGGGGSGPPPPPLWIRTWNLLCHKYTSLGRSSFCLSIDINVLG